MQSSGISSLATTSASQSQSAPTRKRLALDGRSAAIDPRVDAVRPDIADIRLAGRVFAPHYASPMPRVIHFETPLRPSSKGDEPALAMLQKGDVFEVLEIAGSHAWGVAPGPALVGYIDASALGETE